MSEQIEKVRLDLSGQDHGYEVVIGYGILEKLGELVESSVGGQGKVKAGVVCDENVVGTWGEKAGEAMRATGWEVTSGAMKVGEEFKNLETVGMLLDWLLEEKLERKSPVVAVGGGITGDVTGYVAASLLRGVPFVQCPTTLLAMVDASVGGKTGVNSKWGKNLIGAFHQPGIVVADTQTLETLPRRELLCGLAECVKHGVIRDEALFDWLLAEAESIHRLDKTVMIELVKRNVAIKAKVVMNDEKEAGERAHLNFGHTFAHALEASTGYNQLKHGEAVSLGMVAAAEFAVARRLCDGVVLERLLAVLEALGLPVKIGDVEGGAVAMPDIDALVEVMRHDKKVEDGKIRLVLPTKIGGVVIVDDAEADEISKAWEIIR
ncbi:3-dehydroquinate synthase [Poriferisphaera sp. WC338]|uniref:3-dehydroquinate synthase n=1 Tax=Poriferisphaera sp. WC338 TaxID=3425129 RepID=UPI003D814C7D